MTEHPTHRRPARGNGWPRPAAALRDALRDGYRGRDLVRDALAGVTVGIVALPLAIALAIATGVPPQFGIYTAIIAGTVIALLGGSRVQVSGPTAAFVVILAPIAERYGLGGLALATVFAGCIQMLLALGGLGRLIQFVPHPVTIGFTAGIATVIGGLQLKEFLGVQPAETPEHFLPKLWTILELVPRANLADVGIGVLTMALLVLWPRVTARVPAPLVALLAAALAGVAAEAILPGAQITTIADRFGSEAAPSGIPQGLPRLGWPWSFHGPGDPTLHFDRDTLRHLAVAAFAIAMLGAIESLLSAVVADGMTGHEHDANGELLAQGIGNVVAPFFGGFAATGAIARTAANVRFGARSPLAALVHALFLLAAILALAPWLGYLPMAGLAALLMRVAWAMADARHFFYSLVASPRSDTFVQLTCFVLTVAVDMVVAVIVGVVLSSLLFMRRMADLADVRMFSEHHRDSNLDLPSGVLVYEIAGPLFFGAAQRAMGAVRSLHRDVRVVVFDMRAVPVMDATGVVNLESAMDRLTRRHVFVILAGVQHQPLRVMARRHLRRPRQLVQVIGSFEEALATARRMGLLLVPEDVPANT